MLFITHFNLQFCNLAVPCVLAWRLGTCCAAATAAAAAAMPRHGAPVPHMLLVTLHMLLRNTCSSLYTLKRSQQPATMAWRGLRLLLSLALLAACRPAAAVISELAAAPMGPLAGARNNLRPRTRRGGVQAASHRLVRHAAPLAAVLQAPRRAPAAAAATCCRRCRPSLKPRPPLAATAADAGYTCSSHRARPQHRTCAT